MNARNSLSHRIASRILLPTIASVMTIGVSIAAAPSPAHAITCRGNVQINKSSQIITPFCEHEQMAKVARTYGIRTTGRRLRSNINHKQRVCEFIGHDIRLSSVCGGLRREDNRGGRFAG
ncbi:MAG: hypothetical protein AAFQ42_02015 [Pseudomonadota bacterium]